MIAWWLFQGLLLGAGFVVFARIGKQGERGLLALGLIAAAAIETAGERIATACAALR